MPGSREGSSEPPRRQDPPPQGASPEGSRDPARRQRWARLFEQLDTNRDGRVDINELREGLARRGMDAGAHAEQASPGQRLGGGGRERWRRRGFGAAQQGSLRRSEGKLRHRGGGGGEGRDGPRRT